MLKQVESNDMNSIASDAIHSYLKDGYRIDSKESVIDRDKDKDCTFKAVLKKDVDGIECKTVITLTEAGKDDSNKTCTYHKVETVGDTKWSEESRTYSCSTDKTKLNSAVKNHVMDNLCKTPRMWWDHADDNFYDYYHNTVRNIFKDFGLHCDWFGDGENADNKTKDDDNDKKFSTDNKSDTDKKDTTYECKCPSAFKHLDDYIKPQESLDFTNVPRYDNVTLEVADDTDNAKREDINNDTFNKLRERLNRLYSTPKDKMSGSFNMNKDSIKEAYDAKARKDWLASKDGPDEEDDLLKLVRLIFGR